MAKKRKMQNIKRITLYLLLVIFCLSPKIVFSQEDRTRLPLVATDEEIKNVILFIGDGMGLAQIAATRIRTFGVEGRLHMERMPVTGLLYTSCADALVTDSPAAGTALATGHKTNKGKISLDPANNKLPTILEECRIRGMSTGMAVTAPITDATPSTFASHVKTRRAEQEIATQYLENRVNVLLGASTSAGYNNIDETIISKAKDTGYVCITTKDELLKVESDYLLGLFQLGRLLPDVEPNLAEMTEKALSILSRNKKGFFLMVEGSQIDWAGHSAKFEDIVRETILFDEAVKTGLDFALKNKQTLVIVTADHETGGLSINDGSLDGKKMQVGWGSGGGHTAVPVPIFAFGPGAENFMGVGHLTDVPKKIAGLLKLKNFPQIRSSSDSD